MLTLIDNFLNRITMYRLVLYFLTALIMAAMGLGAAGILPYSPILLLYSVALITVACWLTNVVFSKFFDAPTNVESTYITAFILVLIITPPVSFVDFQFLEIAFWASVLAITSKYIIAIRRKHIFNPAAFGVALTALALSQFASWWVGTISMLPFVLIGGLLVTRKTLRADLVLSFLIGVTFSSLILYLSAPAILLTNAWKLLLTTQIPFFAFVMLTEPLTTPPKRSMRIVYGVITGFLSAPWVHLWSFYFTPELALLAGNVFSYLVSPKTKLLLKLKEKIAVATDTYDFRFTPDRKLKFRPGQYLEWTLGHPHPDSRGNRRYFTISSAPTEKDLAIGIKFNPQSSSFKKNLLSMKPGGTLVASQLSGEFLLPDDPAAKIVLIAGGIGVTPYRSMIKDLLDRGERRPIVLFYSNRNPADIAYKDVFDEAASKLGIKTVYTLTDRESVPGGWSGYTGYIDEQMIRKEVPDFLKRHFYLSGPHSMVIAFDKTLRAMGVHRSKIIQDFFPGFA